MARDEGTLTKHEIELLEVYRQYRPRIEVTRRFIPGKKVPCEGHYEYSVDGHEPIGEGAYKLLKMHLLQENF